jgi:uncharacterized repeat protein (TIGR03837 family)
MRWDIFCTVIDNFGDIAISWRLAADLARRGQQVWLWVDDASALAWLAPDGCPGVTVQRWTRPLPPQVLAGPALAEMSPGDVWIEAFGCDMPPEFIAAMAPRLADGAMPPVWLNLEYLSAERYVARNHGLPSPTRHAPVAGGVKWFYYPGFTADTGGLLREPDLQARQAAFDAPAWRAALAPRLRTLHGRAGGVAGGGLNGGLGAVTDAVRYVSLFCYEPASLPALLVQLDRAATPTHLLVTAGRATAAVEAALATWPGLREPGRAASALSISFLPTLTQHDYDHLLWACDLNFVRGEDSIVRAIWAGRPFVWHIYPQDDGVHHEKLDAFLDVLQAPASLRELHAAWNADAPAAVLPDIAGHAAEWHDAAGRCRAALSALPDLTTRLLQFVLEKR